MDTLAAALRGLLADALCSPEVREQLRAVVRDELANASPRQAPCPSADPLLSVKQAAAHAGVTEGTIRDWISHGKLRAKRAGNRWRIALADLDAAMAAPSDEGEQVDVDALAAKIVRMDQHRMRG